MIQSMTGFGKYSKSFEDYTITVEIKSLNSKFTDLNLKLPQGLRCYELELRKQISDTLVRGKIDALIQFQKTKDIPSTEINSDIIKHYIEQLQKIVPESSRETLLSLAVKMPEVMHTTESDLANHLPQIKECINHALLHLEQFRIQEGKNLMNDFILRIENLFSLLHNVENIDPERTTLVKEKLTKAIETVAQADPNRFEQELIYYIEKYDVSEEKTRLKSHLNYFLQTLESEDSNGKILGFIAQEIGREINTLGSKANYAPMQKIVVQMKDELEKIKEQILNVL